MKRRKFNLKFLTGTWANDDVDITPTLKMCTANKTHKDAVKVTVTDVGVCWLKWAIVFRFTTIQYLD